MILVALFYLLLALRVRISLEGALRGTAGSFALGAGAVGINLRFDGIIRKEKGHVFPVMASRYGAHAKKKRKKATHKKTLRMARLYFWFAKTGRMERLSVHIRIGVGDAALTAVAAGALRALAAAAFERVKRGAQVDLCVAPEFGDASFAAHVRCIFSCQLGDIMLAAIRVALKKRKKKAGERDWVGKASH